MAGLVEAFCVVVAFVTEDSLAGVVIAGFKLFDLGCTLPSSKLFKTGRNPRNMIDEEKRKESVCTAICLVY